MTLAGVRILLAEDNPTNQLVATQMLETLGAHVTLAVDGAEALAIVTSLSFDVALIDIEMPHISGIDLIRRIRLMDPPLCDLPLVALTAYVMREHRAAIEEAGADGIIAKPILSIEQFGEDIRSFIADRGGSREPARAVPAPSGEASCMDMATFSALKASFDEPTFQELLEKLTADIGSAGDRIASGIETSDLDKVRAGSHVLISVAGAVGAFHLQDLAQCLNSAGHAADTTQVERTGSALLKEAEQVLAFVQGAKEE